MDQSEPKGVTIEPITAPSQSSPETERHFPTRRKFLKYVAGVAGSALTAVTSFEWIAQSQRNSSQKEKRAFVHQIPTPTPESQDTPSPHPEGKAIDHQFSQTPTPTEVKETTPELTPFAKFVMGDIAPEDMDDFKNNIKEARNQIPPIDNEIRIQRIRGADKQSGIYKEIYDIINNSQYQSIFDSLIGEAGNINQMKENLVKMVASIIYVESAGNPNQPIHTNPNKEPVVGLTQVDPTALETIMNFFGPSESTVRREKAKLYFGIDGTVIDDMLAKPHHISHENKPTEIESFLSSPNINYRVAIMHVMNLYKTFPDFGLIAGAYNLGSGIMRIAIKAYEITAKGRDADLLESRFGNPSLTPASQEYVKQDHISYETLQKNQAVRNILEGEEQLFIDNQNVVIPYKIGENDLKGVYRYLAAATLLFPEDFQGLRW